MSTSALTCVHSISLVLCMDSAEYIHNCADVLLYTDIFTLSHVKYNGVIICNLFINVKEVFLIIWLNNEISSLTSNIVFWGWCREVIKDINCDVHTTYAVVCTFPSLVKDAHSYCPGEVWVHVYWLYEIFTVANYWSPGGNFLFYTWLQGFTINFCCNYKTMYITIVTVILVILISTR